MLHFSFLSCIRVVSSPFPWTVQNGEVSPDQKEWYAKFLFFSVLTTIPSSLFSGIARDFSILHSTFHRNRRRKCLQVCCLIALFNRLCYPVVFLIDSRRYFSHRLKKRGNQTSRYRGMEVRKCLLRLMILTWLF